MAKFGAYMLHSAVLIDWLQSSQHLMNSGMWFALLADVTFPADFPLQ